MSDYRQAYYDRFGYDRGDFIPCELCGKKAVEIHHIIHGAGKRDHDINNLMALCRECHTQAHQNRVNRITLKLKHAEFLRYNA